MNPSASAGPVWSRLHLGFLSGALLALLACAGTPGPTGPSTDATVSVSTLVARAERAAATGDHSTAVAAYAEALERTPWNERLRRALASAHVERARATRASEGVFGLDAAERDLREAFRLEPADPAIRLSLAALLADRATRSIDPSKAGELRAEARELDPKLGDAGSGVRADLERRLDLAYELIERGQLEAGVLRLESLHRAHPEHPATTRLLAQSRVRQALLASERGRHSEAAEFLGRSVSVYAELPARMAEETPVREEIRSAHRGRVVAWLNAGRRSEARRALGEAAEVGFHFPELSRVAVPYGSTE